MGNHTGTPTSLLAGQHSKSKQSSRSQRQAMRHYTADETLLHVLGLFRSLKSFARKTEFIESQSSYALDRKYFALTWEQATSALVADGRLQQNKAGALSLPGGTGSAAAKRRMQNERAIDSQRAWDEAFRR